MGRPRTKLSANPQAVVSRDWTAANRAHRNEYMRIYMLGYAAGKRAAEQKSKGAAS